MTRHGGHPVLGLLGAPELEWLLQSVRKRLARGGEVTGVVVNRDPSPAEHEALARLQGKRARGRRLSVDLGELDLELRRLGLELGLRTAVEALTGPVVDLRGERLELHRCWGTLFDAARAKLCNGPAREWLEELAGSGLLRRLTRDDPRRGQELLEGALGLAARLPERGVPIAELASAVAGDAHALDPGEPLGTLGVRLAAGIAGIEKPSDAASRRDAWAAAGVLCDELSAPVLTLNLRARPDNPTGQALALHAGEGEPCRLSIRQLLRCPPLVDRNVTGPRVFICENPSVVAAAANRLGPRSAPLVSLEGHPKTAARILLDLLVRAGIVLMYHGDFDWGGIRIANLVVARHGVIPWRFSTSDYLATSGGRRLAGRPVEADWDPALAPAMSSERRAVHEEQLLGPLLADLSKPGDGAAFLADR